MSHLNAFSFSPDNNIRDLFRLEQNLSHRVMRQRYRDKSTLIWEGTKTRDEQWKHSNNHGGIAGRLSSLKSEQHNITNVNFPPAMTHSFCVSSLKSAQKSAPTTAPPMTKRITDQPQNNVLTIIDSSGLSQIYKPTTFFLISNPLLVNRCLDVCLHW